MSVLELVVNRSARGILGPRALAFVVAAVAASLTGHGLAHAQGMGMGGFRSVGGISVDAQGIVQNLAPNVAEDLAAERRDAVKSLRLGKPGEVRRVSLARLVAAVDEFASSGKALQPEVLFLGGLERITHVFVDPDGHDIILAGPADTATVDAAGNVVGATSGRPLLQLEDFVVALRAIDGARQGGIRCSIDPSPEGVAKLQQYLRSLKAIGDPEVTLRSMEESLGPQRVTVGGVPAGSRLARVLVAADYRMKRIGMGLEPSGVPGLPSYLSMVPPGSTTGATLPRFWLEASYDPIARDADELAWRITGRRIKCLTENDALAKDGGRDVIERGKAPTDKVAEKWCAAMTGQYDALAARQPVFTELVNCIDLAVVAALIHGRQLDKRAGLDLGVLLDDKKLTLPEYEAPANTSTVASAVKKGSRWVVSASGGVQFQPWEFAGQIVESGDDGGRAAALASRPADNWWWD
jgi:hypothetical protein